MKIPKVKRFAFTAILWMAIAGNANAEPSAELDASSNANSIANSNSYSNSNENSKSAPSSSATRIAEASRLRDLPKETADPTAPLASITLQAERSIETGGALNSTSGAASGSSPGLTTFGLNVANPYRLWSQSSLLHTAIRRGSTHLTNILVFDRSWGRIGFGVNARLIAPPPGRDDLQAGPTLGFVQNVDRCRFGLLNTNYFNDEASVSAVQIIAGCSLGDGWSISAGNFTALYNWRTGRILELPLSLQLGRVVSIQRQPLQFFINPVYQTQDSPGVDRWKITVGVTFVADHLADHP